MSFWNDITDPLIGGGIGLVAGGWPAAGAGALLGLGYDAVANNGMFQVGNPNGDPYSGMAQYPGYNPVFDNSMAVGMNAPGQRYLEGEASRQGPSPWASLMTGQQNLEETQARDRAAKNVAGQVSQAQSNLASQGGLTSGARERTQEAGTRGYIDASQDAARQGNLNRMQVGINDEQNKLSNIGTVAGMENTNALANMSAQMKARQSLNDYNMNMYNTQMQAWGAGKQAQATENAGKK